MELNDANRQTSAQYNRTENLNVYGDAMIETSNGFFGSVSWNQQYSYYPSLYQPTVLRGGWWNGIVARASTPFVYSGYVGNPSYDVGSRAVVVTL